MIKAIHVSTVVLTLILFLVRGGWYYFRADKVMPGPLRYLPHLNDTVLTVTGIWMAVLYSISPLDQSWFLVKIVALFAYIGLGMYAFKEKHLYGRRLVAWGLALCVFFYIFGVVRTHSVLVIF